MAGTKTGQSGPVCNVDLWIVLVDLVDSITSTVQWLRVPSYTDIPGNEREDRLAEEGRVPPLAPPPPPFVPAAPLSKLQVDSGGTSSGSSTASSTSDDEDVFLSSSDDMSFSTDVSDTRLRGTWDSDSDGFSTDVSESRKRRRGGDRALRRRGASGASGARGNNGGGAYQKHAWLPSHGRWRGRRARHRAYPP